MARAPDLTVVKLGGSHAFSGRLTAWLELLASAAGRVVVVPGGGPFADVVRQAQPKMGFDDRAAHQMGLLAMSQFGCALASLRPGYVIAASLPAIRRAARAGQVPVWSPVPMASAAADLPASWDVTADSLAAWLAARLGAVRLVFVKQIAPGAPGSLEALIAAGLLDRFLPHVLGGRAVEAYIAGPDDHAAVRAIVEGRSVGPRWRVRE
jgi:5-(aminomethyl)-3-furanmethanol phosphate kinase